MTAPPPYSHEPRLMPGWYRSPPRRMPPELIALLIVLCIGVGMCLAGALRGPRTATVADLVPRCADAAAPCRGRAQ